MTDVAPTFSEFSWYVHVWKYSNYYATLRFYRDSAYICEKPLKQLNRDREGYLGVRFWDCGVRKRTPVRTNGPIAMLAAGILMSLTPLFERQLQKSSTSRYILTVR